MLLQLASSCELALSAKETSCGARGPVSSVVSAPSPPAFPRPPRGRPRAHQRIAGPSPGAWYSSQRVRPQKWSIQDAVRIAWRVDLHLYRYLSVLNLSVHARPLCIGLTWTWTGTLTGTRTGTCAASCESHETRNLFQFRTKRRPPLPVSGN